MTKLSIMGVVLLATCISLTTALTVVDPPLDTCAGISCTPVECKAPFKKMSAEETGMCCDMCDTEEVDAPEDRSWTKGLTGGVPPNNNADKILCRGVMCPKPQCEEFDQVFDGRCCTKCKTTAVVSAADFAASYK